MYRLNRTQHTNLKYLHPLRGMQYIHYRYVYFTGYVKRLAPAFSLLPYFLIMSLSFCIVYLILEWIQGAEKIVMLVGSLITSLIGVITLLDIYARIVKIRRQLSYFKRTIDKTYRKVYNMDKNG